MKSSKFFKNVRSDNLMDIDNYDTNDTSRLLYYNPAMNVNTSTRKHELKKRRRLEKERERLQKVKRVQSNNPMNIEVEVEKPIIRTRVVKEIDEIKEEEINEKIEEENENDIKDNEDNILEKKSENTVENPMSSNNGNKKSGSPKTKNVEVKLPKTEAPRPPKKGKCLVVPPPSPENERRNDEKEEVEEVEEDVELEKDVEVEKDVYTKDDILFNLEIIAGLKTNEKLSCYSRRFAVNDPGYTQGLSRWYYSDDRAKTLEKLIEVIDSAFAMIDETYNKEFETQREEGKTVDLANITLNETNTDIIKKFNSYLNSTIKGLEKLRSTYSKDQRMDAGLKLLIDRIRGKTTRIEGTFKINN